MTQGYYKKIQYSEKHGLQEIGAFLAASHSLGTYRRTYSGTWLLRIKRRTGGHTWKQLDPDQVPKEIFMLMLLKGIT